MGYIGIDIPLKQEDGISIEERAEEEPLEEQEEPKKKGGKSFKRFLFILLIVGVVVGGGLAAIVVHQLLNPITGVQIYLEEGSNPEEIPVVVLVNTGMFSEYEGEVDIRVTAPTSAADVLIPITIRGSVAFTSIRYDSFYTGNGNYVFSVSVEGFTGMTDKNLMKTAHFMRVSPPTGNNITSTVTTSFSLDVDQYANRLRDADVMGNGTLYLVNSSTEEILAYAYFRVNHPHSTTPLEMGTVGGASSAEITGDYIIIFYFSEESYPSGQDALVRVVFHNALEPSAIVHGEGESFVLIGAIEEA